ncbi:MAG TPA: ATP-binding cassette domain-containing protein [Candidatus Polarisedimenticolia bacterium]|nr:ATP-binding cassette domain-containing protein [Candidatus Polarisedimenticolia bacterium]
MLEVSDISKIYGTRTVVDRVSFTVPKGEILGFLGPNGAGKTTTMRIITGYVPPTTGTAKVAGFDVQEQPLEVKRRLGYLPEHPPLYPEMLVRPYLEFTARIRGVPRRQLKARTDRAIERCGLQAVAGRLIGVLSKGYQQRVGLAQAILHEPDLLILDEPTVGLDPTQIREIRSLIKSFAGEHTVILSTHILAEVTMTCHRVMIINEGRIAAEDTLEALAARGGGGRVLVRFARPAEDAPAALRAVPGVAAVDVPDAKDGALVASQRPGQDAREAIAALAVGRGWGLLEMRPITRSLEDIFIDIIRGEAAPAPDHGGGAATPAPDAGGSAA